MTTSQRWEGRVVGTMKTLTLVSVSLFALSCKGPELQSSVGALRFEPSKVDLGKSCVGQWTDAHLTVRNEGRASAPLEWDALDAPFEVVLLPLSAESGSNDVRIRARANVPGRYTATLRFTSDGQHYQSALVFQVSASPQCPMTDPCHLAQFNPLTGQCEEEVLADGVACDTSSVCVIGGTCQQGRCVGTPRSCDDQNACTVDVCNAVNGCEHLPAPPCPGDGSCMKGVCDPTSGCGLEPMADGEACGPTQTCDAAQVCISGACVVRDPPDGYVCAQASPCQGEGRCAGAQCVRGAPLTLTSNWDFDSLFGADPDAGAVPQQYHDFVLENDGALSLTGFFQAPPRLRANTLEAKDALDGNARRCMMWNNRLICADYPSAVNGKISAINLGSGETAWTFDVRTARPDFLNVASTVFMARMAVQGSDRLAALFEAYPKSNNPQATGNCRLYFLVVVDALGNLVSGQQLQDPVLDACNHPHPYGFAADSVGNLFISFSQTIGQPAPLVPGNNTTVMSFTRDGVFRWKFNDPTLVGGELAVATGLLYPENGNLAIMAATGQTAFRLQAPFGRLVVTQERSVPAPTVGGTVLNGYEAGTPAQRWAHTLAPSEHFWSDQIRLAQWAVRGGSRTVALTFTEKLGQTYLKAIDTRDGSEAFTCPMSLTARGAPQLFEVSKGSISVMEGSDTCGKCDPPYANSSAAFHTVPVPFITPAQEPWLGTFGGPGHDHREEVLFAPPPHQQ